uniref:Uncharacterized protein n=1 Tax=Caenorhabditis japonica TaxID=281687 RepID=A0A8R1E524_CAEJA
MIERCGAEERTSTPPPAASSGAAVGSERTLRDGTATLAELKEKRIGSRWSFGSTWLGSPQLDATRRQKQVAKRNVKRYVLPGSEPGARAVTIPVFSISSTFRAAPSFFLSFLQPPDLLPSRPSLFFSSLFVRFRPFSRIL